MSEIREKIDQVIKLGLAEFLKSHGFKKTGRNWRKQTHEDWLLVHVQASSRNSCNAGKFAVNLGIYNTAIENMADRLFYKDGEKPTAQGCTLRCRLNDKGFGHDYWWEIESDTDLQRTSDDVLEKMQTIGLPWLLANNDLKVIYDVLRDSPTTAAIAAAYLSGDKHEASRRAKVAIENSRVGGESTKKWARKVGIEFQ